VLSRKTHKRPGRRYQHRAGAGNQPTKGDRSPCLKLPNWPPARSPPTDQLVIELVEPDNDLPNAVVIRWPARPTATPPADLDKTVATSMRILANAIIELAAIKVWKKL
jgi:hypothetical protein